MLENVKKALMQFDADMTKADAKKAAALDALNKLFEVKGKRGQHVPEKAKSTKAYGDQYRQILAEYEKAVAEAREKHKADADAAIVRAYADILVTAQKTPSDDILNGIKALDMLKPENVTKEEILLFMENSKNYIACKNLVQIAERAKITIPTITLQDAADLLKRVGKEVDDFFDHYNPLSYKTAATVRGSNPAINNADKVLDNFMQGYFVTDTSFLEVVNDLKLKTTDAENTARKKELEARVDAIEKGVTMSEADKLKLYLN